MSLKTGQHSFPPMSIPVTSVDLADRIKLKEYLLVYGASKVDEIHKGGVNVSLRELTSELIDNIHIYEPVLSRLNYFAATADN